MIVINKLWWNSYNFYYSIIWYTYKETIIVENTNAYIILTTDIIIWQLTKLWWLIIIATF